MSTLPFKIMQSDGGVLKCLATVSDEVMAQSLFNALIEDLWDEKGTPPTVWMEEWVDGRWTIFKEVEIDKQRKLYRQLMDTREISPDDRILWRRLTDNEQDVLIRALERYIDNLKSKMHMESRRTFLRLVNDCTFGHDETKKRLEKLIFDPWDKIRHMENLMAYLRRNPIIIESELYLPQQL